MRFRMIACAVCVHSVWLATGCATPFDRPPNQLDTTPTDKSTPGPPPSIFRSEGGYESAKNAIPTLTDSSNADAYVRYALFHSPGVEAAYQQWRAASERIPQARALPDPRLSVGFFLEEVETRVGPQQARVGLSQTFPWPGILGDREDAAEQEARAAWQRFQNARLAVTERVVRTLHELTYLDRAIQINRENLDLLRSFEGIVRSRYRVGTGSHPELIRVQVELGQLDDRLRRLEAMRPAYAAELNAVLNRPGNTPVPVLGRLPGVVASIDADALDELARRNNPALLAMDEQTEAARTRTELARRADLPDISVGLDYIFTGEAVSAGVPESGDDPVLLNFGITVPLWREKYEAGVRESIAQRLSITHERAEQANLLSAAIHRAWFEHNDADRRVRLFEQTLIPKAEESLRASLAGFRTGGTGFLDLLDTERTLLEFSLSAERARADRGKALATLNRLAGGAIPTDRADRQNTGTQPDTDTSSEEEQ